VSENPFGWSTESSERQEDEQVEKNMFGSSERSDGTESPEEKKKKPLKQIGQIFNFMHKNKKNKRQSSAKKPADRPNSSRTTTSKKEKKKEIKKEKNERWIPVIEQRMSLAQMSKESPTIHEQFQRMKRTEMEQTEEGMPFGQILEDRNEQYDD